MKLEKLINSTTEDEFVNYDFKKEIFDLRQLPYNNENHILNMILYKGNIYGAQSDCDRLPLTLELYNKLWGNEYKFWDTKQTEFVEANGETMNSFVTPYKSIYKENYDFSNSSTSKLFNEYAKLTHTIGNFIPVYAIKGERWASPFNQARARAVGDYWDLTLYHIKIFFDLKKKKDMSNESFSDYLSNLKRDDIKDEEWILTKAYIVNSKEWLLSYNTWENFIEMNFLQNFLVDPNTLSSEPKEFWKGHFTGKINTQNEKDIINFLTFVNNAIQKRSSLIYKALKDIEIKP